MSNQHVSKKPHWKITYGPHAYSITMLFITMLFGLMPIWANWLFLNNFAGDFSKEGQRVTFASFIRGGDFALFSASLLGPCIFLAFRGQAATLLKMIRGIVPILIVFFAVFLYTGVTVYKATLGQSQQFQLNYGFLVTSSVGIFMVSTYLFFGSTLREAKGAPELYSDMLSGDSISDTEPVSNSLGDMVDK